MAKNRPRNLLGRQVDILIFSRIDFSGEYFGLKFGEML